MENKRERLKYVDLIRVIAMVTVLVCHYTRSLEYAGVGYVNKILPDSIFNVYLGSFGVSLFFIVSGISLMYTYSGKIGAKKYFKKRILGIYPMYWIAYLIAFLYFFVKNRGFYTDTPKIKILLTVIGMDGYTNWFGDNFYLLGEWFLGCIIILYILFPLLKLGIEKKPVLTGIIIGLIYVLTCIFYRGPMPLQCVFLVRIPEFALGMYFVKYGWKVNLPIAAVCTAILVVSSFVDLSMINTVHVTVVMGVASFTLITYICKFIKVQAFHNICEMIGKYSYAVFLCHHVLIQELAYHFSGKVIGRTENYILFLLCLILTGIVTKLLYMCNSAVINKCREIHLIK